MTRNTARLILLLALTGLLLGCAGKPRQLMPTPSIYQQPGGKTLFAQAPEALGSSTDVDLLYITDRGPQTDPESTLPYGQTRARHLAFGSAKVRIGPGMSWGDLKRQSLTDKRTQDTDMSLGAVTKIGSFPKEPYGIFNDQGKVFRDEAVLKEHRLAKQQLREEVSQRIAASPRKEVILYVHGFNETFASAAFTAAELCHFLGRESVCAFFTWPAASKGNFLTAYTATTESAQFAEDHLKKTIRMLATTPGVERVQLLAHSRGTAVLLEAIGELFRETIAAGKEPSKIFNIDNLVMFSPDIDVDVAAQTITSYVSDPDLISVWPTGRIPRLLHGRLTIYSSPNDRALLVSRILFRSQSRVGNLDADGVSQEAQDYLAHLGKLDLIIFKGKRSDAIGHSYFTTNPRVSSDLIAMLRYGKRLGEPGRELEQVGPIVWRFPAGN